MSGKNNDEVVRSKCKCNSTYNGQPRIYSETQKQHIKPNQIKHYLIYWQRKFIEQQFHMTYQIVGLRHRNLIIRHTTKHRIRPQSRLIMRFVIIYGFFCCAHPAFSIMSEQLFPL